MNKLTIYPQEISINVKEDQNLLEALRDEGIYIKSSCGGHASCNDCVVKIRGGEDNLCEAPFEELQLLGNVFHITKERLACQLKINGEVSIDISKHDKAIDEDRLKNKNNRRPPTKVRKKEEVEETHQERMQNREEKDKERASWQKHWENDKDPMKPKRLGGGKRPKPFNTDLEEPQKKPAPAPSTESAFPKSPEQKKDRGDFQKKREKKDSE